MPGSVGGGHGGGFGGGHGGSFGGGRGGSFGGGRSSGSNIHIGAPFRAGSSLYRRGTSNNKGCASGLLGLLFIPFLIVVVMIGSIVSSITNGSGSSSVRTSEIEKEKLSPALCTPLTDCCESELPDVLDAEGEEMIDQAIQEYYEATGVQPYFILKGEIDGNASPDEDAIDVYMTEKYISLFGDDEGHLLVLMLFRDYSDYDRYYIPGLNISDTVSTENCEELLYSIDDCAANTYSVAEAVSGAFTECAQTVMYDTVIEFGNDTNRSDDSGGAIMAAGFFFAVLFAGAVIFVVVWVSKNKKEPALKPAGPSEYQEVNSAPAFTGTYSTDGGKKKYNYPVRCPHCGATAYPRDDGTCEYCDGKVD